ncbi:cobyrinate a,c-diamide synthase [Nakamurella antarctica]|uniref:cobyrinate a,c-diamide synthase n=1 Tax=Nakamurella antarctica TaxID=1902245 RepID=UPI0019D29736|nr:cobyrinate a,c-diamide synthase [Nakamurella antarctica]
MVEPVRTVLPRVVIAAPASGHGKTTVATGLMAALGRTGLVVSCHKIGPDYIDPGYHSLATGRPGRNLDAHMVGESRLAPLLLHGAATPVQADIAVIEGVMGLYDGAIGTDGFSSTAHVARVLGAEIILVVDISSASRTIAAMVHGLATFEPGIRIGGVILNKAGSVRHSDEVTRAMAATGIPVIGVLKRDDGISAPSRHLGLIPMAERGEAEFALDLLAAQVAAGVDLDAVRAIAGRAALVEATPWDPAAEMAALQVYPGAQRPVVAIAGGRAFTFRYPETDELLRAAGLDPVVFDPMTDTELPAGTAGIYLGGGFPEVHAADLAGNAHMRENLLAAINSGMPTVAECAGLLYLCRSLDGTEMVGAVPADGRMSPKLTLSYRQAKAPAMSALAPLGLTVTGHEFHRTIVEPAQSEVPAWVRSDAEMGFALDPADTGRATVHASYLHTHWAGYPQLAAQFACAVKDFAQAQAQAQAETQAHAPIEALPSL